MLKNIATYFHPKYDNLHRSPTLRKPHAPLTLSGVPREEEETKTSEAE
jgi:hypothetical protein